ncbi:MAG TPA: hypothetical protein VLN59_04055 [Burkholderiales bacterium]|nr:hypothetical protein [Burkholderiales bacterium]
MTQATVSMISGAGGKGPACFLRVAASGARTVIPAFGEARHRDAWQRAFTPARVTWEGAIAL